MSFTKLLSPRTKRISPCLRSALPSMRFSSTFPEENIARYCKGGYHPVRIGDTFNQGKYKIVNKLGYGAYSTAWIAFDFQRKQHVALKILTADSLGSGHESFEMGILRRIHATKTSHNGAQHVLDLLDDFEHQGPNGKHACLVFKAMGPDLGKYRRLFDKQRIPLPIMRDISRQLLLALQYLHDTCRVIHTDIKPNNILVETAAIDEMFREAPSEVFLPSEPRPDPSQDFYIESTQVSSAEEEIERPTNLSVRLADLGTACWVDKHLTEWIQPQMLRAPEVILGASWDQKVDIWNLGLIIWELAEGQLVFDGCWTPKNDYTPEAHLAQMTAIFGALPNHLLGRSKDRSRYFNYEGRPLTPSPFPPCSLGQFSKNPNLSGKERNEFMGFIESMVKLDPAERPDAHQLLEAPWLARKGL